MMVIIMELMVNQFHKMDQMEIIRIRMEVMEWVKMIMNLWTKSMRIILTINH